MPPDAPGFAPDSVEMVANEERGEPGFAGEIRAFLSVVEGGFAKWLGERAWW